MKMLSICAGMFALTVPLVPALADEMAMKPPTHEGPSISTPASKIQLRG